MRINPDLAHMTPARAKELLAGDIEGYRLPIIELIERQAAHITHLRASLRACTNALKAYTPGDYAPGQQIIRQAMQLLGEQT